MKITEGWQLNRMRRALRVIAEHAERYAQPNPDLIEKGTNNAWLGILEAIQDHSGVDMGDFERLRQFAMGFPDGTKPEGRHWPRIGSAARRRAIADFLVDPDASVAPLKPVELQTFAPNVQAPLALLEFLETAVLGDRAIEAGQLEGHYLSDAEEGDVLVRRRLTLERPVETDGLLQAVMIEECFDAEAPDETPDQIARFAGWAVISREDVVHLFLKHAEQSSNCAFMSIAVDDDAFDGAAVMRIAFVRQDVPLVFSDPQLEDGPEEARLAAELAPLICVFNRVGKNS
ncbi:MAG: hypothetical protein AAF192_10330 [Pseudomonadota bacterium]